MKAEDTVMLESQRDANGRAHADLRKQAEITWDKAIREVVEWIRNNKYFMNYINRYHNEEWQAKLKDWGIND